MCSKEMYPLSPVDQYRLQLYQYAVQRLYPAVTVAGAGTGYPHHPAAAPGYPRLTIGLRPEEPKPQHSYIGLIAMAILSSPEYKLVLSDIYQYILDHYPYFRTRGPGWRNSIRHNLSLNDCFVKAGRSANGKGHYWAIHPANVEDFKKGDFRRRKAQRKVRRHMGLAVDDDGADSPSPPPTPLSGAGGVPRMTGPVQLTTNQAWPVRKKRQFDVASLLAPDPEDEPPVSPASPWPCALLNRQLMAKYCGGQSQSPAGQPCHSPPGGQPQQTGQLSASPPCLSRV